MQESIFFIENNLNTIKEKGIKGIQIYCGLWCENGKTCFSMYDVMHFI